MCLGLFGSRYFVDMFSANDLLILVVSMLPYGVCGALHGFDSYDAKAWRRFTVARLLRVLRLVKLVRFDSLFRELWILVRGITYSFRVLFWGMGIGFLIIFIFSVPSTSFFGYNPSFQGMYDGWQMDLVGVDINEYTLVRSLWFYVLSIYDYPSSSTIIHPLHLQLSILSSIGSALCRRQCVRSFKY